MMKDITCRLCGLPMTIDNANIEWCTDRAGNATCVYLVHAQCNGINDAIGVVSVSVAKFVDGFDFYAECYKLRIVFGWYEVCAKMKRMFDDGNHPGGYYFLSDEEKDVLKDWIEGNVRRVKRVVHTHSSYGLKHDFSASERGFYVTNGEFKGAMLANGFDPVNKHDKNWLFKAKLVKDMPTVPVLKNNIGSKSISFNKWMLRQSYRDDEIGDFARDLKSDQRWFDRNSSPSIKEMRAYFDKSPIWGWSAKDRICELYCEWKREFGVKPRMGFTARYVSARVRYLVFTRDEYCCRICGRSAQDGTQLEIDHIIPRSKGGSHEITNLQTLCVDCNRGKSNL